LNPFKFDSLLLVLDARPLLDGICEDGLFLLCEDDLLKAIFEKELPMISMIAIATKPTIPNKLFLLRFDKIFYIITTGIIMVIYGRLNIILSSNTIFYNYCNIR
jgi:hypothetical protein